MDTQDSHLTLVNKLQQVQEACVGFQELDLPNVVIELVVILLRMQVQLVVHNI